MKYILFLMSLISINSNAAISHCDYNLQDFYVIDGHKTQNYNVNDSYYFSKVECSYELAALYDGDKLTIYSNGEFQSINVNNLYSDAILVVKDDTLAFYDGDKFYIFADGKLSTVNAYDEYELANIFIQEKTIMLYDGHDLFYFCESSLQKLNVSDNMAARELNTNNEDDVTVFSAIMIGRRIYQIENESCKLTIY